MLLSLLLVPMLVWFYLRLQKRREQERANLGTMGFATIGNTKPIGRRRHIPPAVFLLSLTLLLFSLARPEMTLTLPRIQGTVILAFDVSNSMAADDLEPTRMEAAKEAARIFVESQPSTVQIGVVAFSNGGLIVQPPTDNQNDILATIERLTPQGSTSLAQGIFTALSAISGNDIIVIPGESDDVFTENLPSIELEFDPSSVVLLLTDGEQTSGTDPLAVAEIAAQAGIRIYTIGIGSTEGSVIEVDGFSILSQLNEAPLQDIAKVTNATYFQADSLETLQEIYENIDLQLTVKGEKREVTGLIAGISLILLLIGGALSMLWLGRIP
jgi:Ca-activated chloride channel family protein